jgi:hypothetical protein
LFPPQLLPQQVLPQQLPSHYSLPRVSRRRLRIKAPSPRVAPVHEEPRQHRQSRLTKTRQCQRCPLFSCRPSVAC